MYPNDTDFNFEAQPTDVVPPWINILMQLLYGFVFLVGLIGNSLVIFVIARFPKMSSVTNVYLLNLAIADVCFIFGLPILITYDSLQYWPFPEFVCKINNGLLPLTYLASSLFLLAIAADRYILVCRPMEASRWRTLTRAKIIAVVVWLLATIPALHIIVFSEVGVYRSRRDWTLKMECNINFRKAEASLGFDSASTVLYYFFVGFAIPLVLISVFYLLILRRIKITKTDADTVAPENTGEQPRKASGNVEIEVKAHSKNVTKVVSTVVAVYFVCWGPYWTLMLLMQFSSGKLFNDHTLRLLYWLSNSLAFSNSTLNPILYAFLSDSFKHSFRQACTCITKFKSSDRATENTVESVSVEKNGEPNAFEMIKI